MNGSQQLPLCVIRAPVNTRSGYGAMSRDIVRHVIEYGKYDVKVHDVNWGTTPSGVLDESEPKDKMILDRIIHENIQRPVDLFISISIPSEFQPMGKFNIGITAGIETTAVSSKWIQGCNRMDVVFTISEHSKTGFVNSRYTTNTSPSEILELTKPIEVLHNCVDTSVFGKNCPTETSLAKKLDDIDESFCFLFVGHWLQGDYGEDRKNVAVMIKLFLETFRQVTTKQPVALVLKTSGAGFSIMDREEILKKIEALKNSVTLEPGQTLPSVYLIHGDLTDREMNTLYNHPKIKAHVNITHGEGFGRPLLEASLSGKPIIASGWSGHLDFLDKDRAVLIGGELTPIEDGSIVEDMIIKGSSWFTPDTKNVMSAFAHVALKYSDFKNPAYDLMLENKKKFSYEAIQKRTFDLLDQYVPAFPVTMPVVLPIGLKKVDE